MVLRTFSNGEFMAFTRYQLIGAPTLDDALNGLKALVSELEEAGKRVVVFSEDRMTLLVERAITEALGGTFLTEVTTFARFLRGSGKILGKQGSVMAINAILTEQANNLRCFKKGAARSVYETIAQLSASGIDGETLLRSADETSGMLSGKLRDLALIVEEYRNFLAEKQLVDENGYLMRLPDAVREQLQGVHIVFFAFPSFTRQTRRGLQAAFEVGKSVTGIFLAGAEVCKNKEVCKGKEEYYTDEAYRAFWKEAEEAGVTKTDEFKEAYLQPSVRTGAAALLSERLFSCKAHKKGARNGIYSFVAEDEREELNFIAATVRARLCLDNNLHCRDVTLLVPNGDYFPVVRRAFQKYGIPFFMDEKRSFLTHPFLAFLLALLQSIADGGLPVSLDGVLQSVYFGAPYADANEYRNYLIKYGGYRGSYHKEIKEDVTGYRIEALKGCRERLLELLALFPVRGVGAASGGAFTAAIRALKEKANAETVTETIREQTDDVALKRFLSLDPLESVLSEIELVAAEKPFTAREFADAIKSGAEALEISMIPESLDAVFVGDATESKFTRTKILFACGLTNALPRVSMDTAVISDGEIKRLREIQLEIEPAIAVVNARARESLALNLTSFEEAIYFTYPNTFIGEETEAGEIFEVLNLFEDELPNERETSDVEKLLSECGAERGAFADGLRERAKEERAEDAPALRIPPSVPSAGKLYFAGEISPTLLEKYFACPYSGYCMRALKLREREERTVLDTDTGTFVHKVLELTARKFNEASGEEEIRAFARRTAEELLREPRFRALLDTEEGVYTGERLVEEGEEVALIAYRGLKGSAFRVLDTEHKVELAELGAKGTTDRVDETDDYVRIVDYKSGSIDDSVVSYYTGRKLQLQLYLKGVSGEKKPAGAFYFPAATGYREEGDTPNRMSGFFCADENVLLLNDTGLKEGEKSEFFEGSRNGKYTQNGMSAEDFSAFLDYSVLVAQKAEGEMREGFIQPTPYEGACEYCKLRSLCGFDGTPRRESAIKSGGIAQIVRKTRGEKK